MKHRSLRRRSRAGLLGALAASALVSVSCHDLDTTRIAPKKATLGDDIYGLFCDRVGAGALPEDLAGASYNAICHYDEAGKYGDRVDTKALPPAKSDAQRVARQRSIAKLERMAQRRSDLILAANHLFPADLEIPDLVKKTGKIGFHDALFDLLQTIVPLYETNPIDPKADPLLPSNTRALGALMAAFGAQGTCAGGQKACSFDEDCGKQGICQQEARDAFSRMSARRGYRPFNVGLGAVRPALAYPDLRQLIISTLGVLGPGGSGAAEMQQVLTTVRQELFSASANVSEAPLYTVDPATLQPNRPREVIELVRDLMLTESPAFANGNGQMLIARRDRRGFVIPAGNTPGMPGTVPPPFSDLNNDGFADVDAFGRFIDQAGSPVSLELPFAIPGVTTTPVDALGRPMSAASAYAYVDTSQTLLGGLARHLKPLLDPTILAAGDPSAWQQEHETAMYALAGAKVLFGEREDATYDYGKERPGGKLVNYRAFRGDDSPIPDLVHAAGQILADKDSDAMLLSLIDLMENHEQLIARLMGAALRIREISLKHDDLANQGQEPKAELGYQVTLWDEMAEIIGKITKRPGLLESLVKALANDAAITPQGNADHMGYALSWFMSFRDEMSYNRSGTHWDGTPGGINGPAVNLTISPSGGSIQDPQTPVDWKAPQTGKNMSLMQRSLQLIHDANGGPACNKAGAKVVADLGVTITWPPFGPPYTECELFEFKNLGIFYLNSMLPPAHPKRSQLVIKSGTLNAILTVLQGFGLDPDTVFQQSSDIKGLTLHPESYALNRLVWYGATSDVYGGMPDFDAQNAGKQVNNFIHSTIEPVSAAWCPKDAIGVPTATTKEDTMRVRNANTIFAWERFGFADYLRPLIEAFANVACTPNISSCDTADFTGEAIFIELFELLNKHWPGPDHGPECQKGSATIPCAESGLNRYQPLLAEAFLTDIIPALHEFAKVAVQVSKIQVKRGPAAGQTWTGAQVLEKMTKVLFDADYATSVGVTDRKGQKAGAWVDGTPTSQVTPYGLFADALHAMDQRFDSACDCAKKTGLDKAECERDVNACRADVELRRGQWKRARSQLVDEFLAVDGEGAAATFRNPTVAPTMVATLKLLREQINANCPDREAGGSCDWARRKLGQKMSDVISRPLFAAIMDVQDKLRQDEKARRGLETFLQYALSPSTENGTALQGTLASFHDILQVVADDGELSPILRAASVAASPASDPGGAGAGDLSLHLLKAFADERFDRYHVFAYILPRLATPIDGTKLSPIEIIMDTIADVNRIDAASVGPMATDDYQGVMSTMRGFMADKTRGFEQLYTIIQDRPKQ